jgi:hypothetical protein
MNRSISLQHALTIERSLVGYAVGMVKPLIRQQSTGTIYLSTENFGI